jgi:hypothetical protein
MGQTDDPFYSPGHVPASRVPRPGERVWELRHALPGRRKKVAYLSNYFIRLLWILKKDSRNPSATSTARSV